MQLPGNPATHDELRWTEITWAGALRTRASAGLGNPVTWGDLLWRHLLYQDYLRSGKEDCRLKLQEPAPVPILLSNRDSDAKQEQTVELQEL